MLKTVALLLFLLMLQGCTDHFLKNDPKTENSEYFSDATDCLNRSSRKEQIKVPTGRSMTTIDVPIGSDAGYFNACMQQAGHPAPKANTESFFNVSLACLNESRNANNADDTYAQCVRRSRITVESPTDEPRK